MLQSLTLFDQLSELYTKCFEHLSLFGCNGQYCTKKLSTVSLSISSVQLLAIRALAYLDSDVQ